MREQADNQVFTLERGEHGQGGTCEGVFDSYTLARKVAEEAMERSPLNYMVFEDGGQGPTEWKTGQCGDWIRIIRRTVVGEPPKKVTYVFTRTQTLTKVVAQEDAYESAQLMLERVEDAPEGCWKTGPVSCHIQEAE